MFVRRPIDQPSPRDGAASRCARGAVLSVVLICSGILPGPSSAQSASFRAVDTNSDGVLTFGELVAAFGRSGATRLLGSSDHNGDGRITILELRRAPDDGGRSADRSPGSSNDRDDDRDDDRGDERDDGDDGGEDDGDDD